MSLRKASRLDHWELAGREIEVNEEGYLLDPNQWDDSIAHALAQEESIGDLTGAHRKLIRYLREQQSKGVALTIRGIGKSGVTTIKEFYDLFRRQSLRLQACDGHV